MDIQLIAYNMKSCKKSQIKPNLFIRKLYKILSSGQNLEVICWTSDDSCFIIKDIHKFSETVLPQYFKHKNISSFIRQLNMYDFHKVKEGSFEFSHPLFKPGEVANLKSITRKASDITSQKDSVQDISERIEKVQSKQVIMEGMLNSLEKSYDDIVEQNQILVEELVKRKRREKIISEMIDLLSRKKSNESGSSGISENLGEFDDLEDI
jgi:osomolarity two-component system response regulator SKN7